MPKKRVVATKVSPELLEIIDLTVKTLGYKNKSSFLRDCIHSKLTEIVAKGGEINNG